MDDVVLSLGRSRSDDSNLELPIAALLRHVMALGSSGSGKTVLCKVLVEEVVRQGLPAICIDPQGDLCSLALAGVDPEALAERGVDPEVAASFHANADVVVFTPASTAGVGLSADPVNLATAGMSASEQTHAISRTAAILTALLGYDPESDDGTGLTAVLDRSLDALVREGKAEGGLAALGEYLHALPPKVEQELSRYLAPRKLETARRRLARLDVGARRLLFHQGAPIDIDMLLGRGEHAVPGKTRVSVIYLNTLHSQEDKDFFVATLVDLLYAWMLKNPSSDPQAMFYIDEVAPFVPPVRKPAAKPGLQLLFKQARKYGVCCLMATQNPGDVDYKSMAQFGTWALGRLTTRQDIKKVEPTLRALVPTASERIVGALPSLGPGEFVLVSPDHWPQPQDLAVRWLVTPHETLDEGRITEMADERWRARFASLLRENASPESGGSEPAAEPESAGEEPDLEAPPASEETPLTEVPAVTEPPVHGPGSVPTGEPTATTEPTVPAWQPPAAVLEQPPTETEPLPSAPTTLEASPPSSIPQVQTPVRTGLTEVAVQSEVQPPVPSASSPVVPPPPLESTPSFAEEPPPPDPLQVRRDAVATFERALAQTMSMTVGDFAKRAGVGEKKARTLLSEMLELGLAGMYPDGRKKMYWARSTQGRPDLGMTRKVVAMVPVVTELAAWARGRDLLRSRVLGLFGDDESIERVDAMHRMVWRVDFEEKVQRPLLQRVFSETHDLRVGSVYLHSKSLDVLVYTADKGIRFLEQPGEYASAVADLDGAAEFIEAGPGALALVESDWTEKKTSAEARAAFGRRFNAAVTKVVPVFVPVWRLTLRVGAGEGFRLVELDSVGGAVVEWPAG